MRSVIIPKLATSKDKGVIVRLDTEKEVFKVTMVDRTLSCEYQTEIPVSLILPDVKIGTIVISTVSDDNNDIIQLQYHTTNNVYDIMYIDVVFTNTLTFVSVLDLEPITCKLHMEDFREHSVEETDYWFKVVGTESSDGTREESDITVSRSLDGEVSIRELNMIVSSY